MPEKTKTMRYAEGEGWDFAALRLRSQPSSSFPGPIYEIHLRTLPFGNESLAEAQIRKMEFIAQA